MTKYALLSIIFVSSLLCAAARADVDNMAFSYSACGQITSVDAEAATVLVPGNDAFLLDQTTSHYIKENGKVVELTGARILGVLKEGQCACISGRMAMGEPPVRFRSFTRTYNVTLVESVSEVDCSAQVPATIEYQRHYEPEETQCGDLGCLGGGFGHM